MTIKPGEAWGARVPRPDGLVAVTDDAALAAHLSAADGDHPGAPVLVTGGDLRRTLGVSRPVEPPDSINALPIDLVEIVLDDGAPHTACAHIVVRSPWWRGGWLRGPVVLVMNAEFIGNWDVAPRGHPNDGRIEVVEAGPDLGVRQRMAARRRLPAAAHVPHPRITTRSVRSARWAFDRPMAVRIDGVGAGTARTVAVTVVPDAGVVHA